MADPERIGPRLLESAVVPDPTPKSERQQFLAELDAEARRQEAEEIKALRRKALNVPPLYADATLESFVTDTPDRLRVHRRAAQYVAAWPDAPLLTVFRGGFGTGKGHLAWAICKQVTATDRCRVVKLSDMIRDLRARWNSDEGDSEDARLTRYRTYGLLVIDEVSRHSFYGQPHQHLYDILDHRLEACRPTILTSNESEQGLADILQGATWDRLSGHGGIIDFGADSYRRRER